MTMRTTTTTTTMKAMTTNPSHTTPRQLPDSQRVVVTGAGWVTPLGHDIDTVWERLLRGESAVAPITHFDASTFATNFAAEVKDFNLADFFALRTGKSLKPVTMRVRRSTGIYAPPRITGTSG